MACLAESDDSRHMCRLGWMEFKAGQEVRRFVAVPEGARWAELRLRAGAHEQPRCRPCTLCQHRMLRPEPTLTFAGINATQAAKCTQFAVAVQRLHGEGDLAAAPDALQRHREPGLHQPAGKPDALLHLPINDLLV